MVSFITAASSAQFTVFDKPFSRLSFSPRLFPVDLVVSPPKGQCFRKRLKQGRKKSRFLFEFSDCCYCGVVRMCKGEREGEEALELELLEFMKNSKNPKLFPTKRELIESGRADLAEAIENSGGWMSMGWDEEIVEDDEKIDEIEDGLASNLEFDIGQNGYVAQARNGSELNVVDHQDSEGISSLEDSSQAASSSGRSIETITEDDGGIDGILNRLERQRSLSFVLSKEKNGSINHVSANAVKDERKTGTLKDAENSHRTERSSDASMDHQISDRLNQSHASISSSLARSDAWRTWSIQRAGVSNTEFEAAEIDFGGKTNGRAVTTSTDKIVVVTNDIKEPLEKTKDVDPSAKEISEVDIKSRLQHLELELSSVLGSLKSSSSGLPQKVKEQMPEDLRKLSDAAEFQENEIMNAHERLRSLRAKLAVLEGKMALAITDAEKVLDEKQKRIDNAQRALQFLRTTCIVWPNPANEVLLAGSFDGWTTQRKMEKLSTGVFSLTLKLYPGQHEIKFIVDGIWKVDPLRPIVNNGGFENNLLIIT